ncbi:MAG: DUF1330 domain-containing protein [Pseudomonadota bacterium]
MTQHIDGTPEIFAQFVSSSHEGPLMMLNLLRFRDRAEYEDGRDVSGREAYAAYAKAAAPFFAKAKGEMIWEGAPLANLIGPLDEIWDAGFIAQYQDKNSFLGMIMDDGYKAIMYHRQAALIDSRLYAFGTSDTGVFG